VIMSPPVQILGGTCPPCPIGIDAPGSLLVTTSTYKRQHALRLY